MSSTFGEQGHRGRVKDPEKDGRLKVNRDKGVKKGKHKKDQGKKSDGGDQ